MAVTNGTTYPNTSASPANRAVFFHALQNSGSCITWVKLRQPTHVVFPAKLVFWKLITISRTIGYQEKTAKQISAPARKR